MHRISRTTLNGLQLCMMQARVIKRLRASVTRAANAGVPAHRPTSPPQNIREPYALRRSSSAALQQQAQWRHASRHRIAAYCASASTYGSQRQRGFGSSQTKPRVVLIAWLGAQQRHFDKYIQLWQSLGHETLAIRPPTPAILVPPVGDWAAGAFLRKLQAAGTASPQQPVVFHTFRLHLSGDTAAVGRTATPRRIRTSRRGS